MMPKRHMHGVTLIELVLVIVLTGVLAGMIVLFAMPLRGYFDTSMRAGLTDAADTALRRIGRDLRLALPNSVRVKTTNSGGQDIYWLEFLQLRTGGRYQADAVGADTCPSGTDAFVFGTADACFRSLGDLDVAPAANDWVVVFNLFAAESGPTTNANAYESGNVSGGNKSKITAYDPSTTRDRIEMDSNNFALDSPGKRFHVAEGPVTYRCDPNLGQILRYWGYNISYTQPVAAPGTGSSTVLVDKVSGCTITYNAAAVAQSAGLVTLRLELSAQNTSGQTETVRLYHTVHVSNVP